MSVRATTWVWDQPMPPSEKIVLLRLADHANPDGGDVYPSVASVAAHTGISERQVQRYIKSFVERGILVITGHAKGGRSNPREYRFTFQFTPRKGDTITSPITDKKGDADDTVSERVTSKKGDIERQQRVTSETERVTPMTRKGDIAVSPEPPITTNTEPSGEPSGMPRNGAAQTLLAVLYEDVLQIGKPTNYSKAVGQAQQLVKAGSSPEEVRDIAEWLLADPFWAAKGITIGLVLNKRDEWRSAKNAPKPTNVTPFQNTTGRAGRGGYTSDQLLAKYRGEL